MKAEYRGEINHFSSFPSFPISLSYRLEVILMKQNKLAKSWWAEGQRGQALMGLGLERDRQTQAKDFQSIFNWCDILEWYHLGA